MTNEHARPITRRRFLQAAGGVVLGGTAIGLLYEASGGAWPVSPRRPSPGLVAGNRSPAASPRPSPAARSFHTRPDLLAPVVTIDTSAGAVAPGLVFLTLDNGADKGGPLIVDNAGEPVWMLSVPGKSVADFRVATYRGQPVLAWWEGSTNAGIGSGECVIADTSYREIARVQAANGRTIDLHEFQITPQGSAFVFADAAVPAALVTGSATASSAVPAQVMDCAIVALVSAATSGAAASSWRVPAQIAPGRSCGHRAKIGAEPARTAGGHHSRDRSLPMFRARTRSTSHPPTPCRCGCHDARRLELGPLSAWSCHSARWRGGRPRRHRACL
ncbi:MAG: arylsulfotransferase family protein [Candidatus Limnocylindrales bacterium]